MKVYWKKCRDVTEFHFHRDEMVTMYRIITGACQQGTQSFLDSLGDKLKDSYTIQEVIELTKDQYGGKRFAEFFQGRE